MTMFEMGKRYEIEIVEAGGARGFIRGVAIDADGTLLKLETNARERIFNTAASTFVGATEWRELPADSIYQPRKPPARGVDNEGWPKEGQ